MLSLKTAQLKLHMKTNTNMSGPLKQYLQMELTIDKQSPDPNISPAPRIGSRPKFKLHVE